MIKSLYTAATGMKVQQLSLDIVANNLANVNTAGFKKSQVSFEDLLYVSLRRPGTDVTDGVRAPVGLEVGSGARAVSTTKLFSNGVLEITNRQLDVAIQGDGFLQVTDPQGQLKYTRNGNLQLDGTTGNIVTSDGLAISPAITVPQGTVAISIGTDGTVQAESGSTPGTATQIGRITLARFVNPSGLLSQGGSYYIETPASGTPTVANPGEQGTGTLQQFFLEKSNVDVVSELVNLIIAQRAYEVNSRAIRSSDEMLSTTNAIVR
jgi:flagellar basal-body rod protein FlgG